MNKETCMALHRRLINAYNQLPIFFKLHEVELNQDISSKLNFQHVTISQQTINRNITVLYIAN